MISQKNLKDHIRTIVISELPDYGYIWIRDAPCRVTHIEKFENPDKHSKNVKAIKKEEKAKVAKAANPDNSDEENEEDENELKRIRFDIVAENIWTGEIAFKGLVKGPTVEVPIFKKSTYSVVYVDTNSDSTKLLDEDFQENEDIPLPVNDNPKLTEEIRKTFKSGKEFSVEVIETMGKTAITKIDLDPQ